MRDLKECQAEVFRRSEQRIARRNKRRRRMLTACIPLALLAAMLLGPRPLPEKPVGNTGLGTQTEGPVKDAANDIIVSVVRIDVSGEGLALSHTDAERLGRIRDILDSSEIRTQYQSSAPELGPESNRSEGDPEEPTQDAAIPGYVITVTMDDGSIAAYHLAEDSLANRTTGDIHVMPRSQIKELKILLGIPNSTAP